MKLIFSVIAGLTALGFVIACIVAEVTARKRLGRDIMAAFAQSGGDAMTPLDLSERVGRIRFERAKERARMKNRYPALQDYASQKRFEPSMEEMESALYHLSRKERLTTPGGVNQNIELEPESLWMLAT